MSWITELADKAENMLNKIDKNAATALQISDAQEISNNKKDIIDSSGEVAIDLSGASQQEQIAAIEQPEDIGLRKQKINTMSLPSSPSRSKLSNDEQELSAFKIALNELTRERNELYELLKKIKNEQDAKEHEKREEELEKLIGELRKERDTNQIELLNLQTENQIQKENVSELETNYLKLQQQYREMADKFEMQLQESVRQRQEFDEYRMKAQRALHAKDLLIEELKLKVGTAECMANTKDQENQVVAEQNLQEEQFQQLLEEKMNLSAKIEELQSVNLLREEEHEKQVKALRSALTTERELAIAAASEQRVLTQEITSLRQQISNLKAAHATQMQEKDEQLKRSLAAKPSESIEHDMRLQTLTAVLVEKQNVLERITAERNALRIQLEKMENQLQRNNVLNMPQDATTNTLLFSNTTDDVKSQFPMLLKENPFDTRVARRVKRGFSSLDSVGIRLGTFLRRYPLMRVFVLMYVGLLHIWVMFVLLSSTPN